MKNLIYLFILFMGPSSFAHNIPGKPSPDHAHYLKLAHTACSIVGKLTESATGEPVLFGDVALYKDGILFTGTQTDFDGNYMIANIAPGTYDVKATYVGFSPKQIKGVVLIEGKETRLDIELSQGIDLDAIVVIEYNVPLIKTNNTYSTGTITASEIRNLPTKNINALAELTAGLSKGKGKKGKKVRARGSRSSGTEYYVDGVRVKGKKAVKIAAESTQIVQVNKPVEQSLAHKLTATEVNDFADWNFWSDIQETDFVRTSLEWKMNPQNRYSIQLKNNEGYAVSGLKVELLDDDEQVMWSTVSDNLGKAELFANFESTTDEVEAKTIRVSNESDVLDELEALAFIGNTQVVAVDENCAESDMLELAFMMDISGSMNDEMAYLRSEITSIIDRLATQYPKKTIRAGVVYFQGHSDRNTINAHPLTDDIEHLTHFIKGQYGGGGDDEAIDLALQTMVEFDWKKNSTKIAFLMGDEELDKVEVNRARQRLYTKKSAEAGIKLVPIGCSGMPKSMEFTMRTMAIVTGGTYLALTDDSGIGGRHTMPTTNAIDIKSLNDIIFDVVTRFTSTTSCDSKQRLTLHVDDNALHENLNKKYGESAVDQSIKVFPSPTTGTFSIRNRDLQQIDKAFICDLAGRIVMQLNTEERHFDISELATGNYFLLYQTRSGAFGSEQIIKISGSPTLAQK